MYPLILDSLPVSDIIASTCFIVESLKSLSARATCSSPATGLPSSLCLISPPSPQTSRMILANITQELPVPRSCENSCFPLAWPVWRAWNFLLVSYPIFLFSILLEFYFWACFIFLPPPVFSHQKIEVLRAWAWIAFSFDSPHLSTPVALTPSICMSPTDTLAPQPPPLSHRWVSTSQRHLAMSTCSLTGSPNRPNRATSQLWMTLLQTTTSRLFYSRALPFNTQYGHGDTCTWQNRRSRRSHCSLPHHPQSVHRTVIWTASHNICFISVYLTHLRSYNPSPTCCHLSPEILQHPFNLSLYVYP